MNNHYIFVVLLTILSQYIVKTNANITACIPLEKLTPERNEDNYSTVLKALKLELTSLLEDTSTKYYDHLDFNFEHPALSAEGELNKVYVENLNQFTLKYFQNIDIIHNSMELFNLTLHNISVRGDYKLNGNIGDLFDIFGEGDFWLNLLNFSISAMSGFPSINKTTACITMDITPRIEKVEGWFNKFMNDEELEDVVNKALLGIVPEAVEIIWNEFKDVLDEELQKLINSIVNASPSYVVSNTRGLEANLNSQGGELNGAL